MKNPGRNVRLLQGHAVFLSMVFILPVIVPYYKDAIGLSFAQFMMGEAIFAAVVILMEVPSGWISDIWSRKMVMVVGTALNIAGYGLLWVADGFALAAFAQGVIGVSCSLMSGTNTALLYDSLAACGREGEYRRQEGFRHGVNLYAIGGSCLAGGFLYGWNIYAPLIFSLLTSLVALILALFMVEPVRVKEPAHKNPLADMLATMRFALHGHAEIAGIILLSSCVFASTKMLLWAQQPYYALLAVPAGAYGALMAAGFALGGLGAQLGHRVDGRFNDTRVLLACAAFVFIACLVNGLWPGYAGLPLMVGGSLIYGFGFPLVQAALNARAPTARRATILSAAQLMVSLIAIPLYFLIGIATDMGGVTVALKMLAGLMAATGLGVAAIKYRYRS